MPTPGPPRLEILPSVSPIPGQHMLLDPVGHQPALAAPFTANTEPEWHNPYNAVSIDPLSGTGGDGGMLGHAPNVQPAGTAPPPSQPMQAPAQYTPAQLASAQLAPANVDSARSAVANALASAPFNPAFAPVTSLNAQPVNVDLHLQAPNAPPVPPWQPPPPQIPPADGTPSLTLPNGGAVAASTSDLLAPPPPPVPPPLPLASNPGAMLPNPTQQPPPPII